MSKLSNKLTSLASCWDNIRSAGYSIKRTDTDVTFTGKKSESIEVAQRVSPPFQISVVEGEVVVSDGVLIIADNIQGFQRITVPGANLGAFPASVYLVVEADSNLVTPYLSTSPVLRQNLAEQITGVNLGKLTIEVEVDTPAPGERGPLVPTRQTDYDVASGVIPSLSLFTRQKITCHQIGSVDSEGKVTQLLDGPILIYCVPNYVSA